MGIVHSLLLLVHGCVEEGLVATCSCRYRVLNRLVVEHVDWEQSLEVACQLTVAELSLLIDAEEAAEVLVVVH